MSLFIEKSITKVTLALFHHCTRVSYVYNDIMLFL